MAYEPSRGSEAEGQELGAAGGIAIHKGAEADHEAEHGQATVPGFGEGDKAKAGSGLGHDCFKLLR